MHAGGERRKTGVTQALGDRERASNRGVACPCRGVGETGRKRGVRRLAYSEAYTLPITATPSVPPRSRVASLTAEPTPALAFGTTPMIASVAGALVRPMPVPSTTICTAIVP